MLVKFDDKSLKMIEVLAHYALKGAGIDALTQVNNIFAFLNSESEMGRQEVAHGNEESDG